MRRPRPFTQDDVTRAVKGARAAGCEVQRVELDVAGKIVIVTTSGSTDLETSSPLEQWKAKSCASGLKASTASVGP
jgi:hypothetical protein